MSSSNDLMYSNTGTSNEVVTSLNRRLEAIRTAEELLIRREQQVAVREEVLRIAITANSHFNEKYRRGDTFDHKNRISVKNAIELASISNSHHNGLAAYDRLGLPRVLTERDVYHMVTTYADSLPPPVSVYGFIKELEERAVELETFAVDIDRQRRVMLNKDVASKRMIANLEVKDKQLTTWTSHLEEALDVINAESRQTQERHQEGEQGEEEIMMWTRRLRMKEAQLAEKEAALDAERQALHSYKQINGMAWKSEPIVTEVTKGVHYERGSAVTESHDRCGSTVCSARSSSHVVGERSGKEDIYTSIGGHSGAILDGNLVSQDRSIIRNTATTREGSDYTTAYYDCERKISVDTDPQRGGNVCGYSDTHLPMDDSDNVHSFTTDSAHYNAGRADGYARDSSAFISSVVVPHRRAPPPPYP